MCVSLVAASLTTEGGVVSVLDGVQLGGGIKVDPYTGHGGIHLRVIVGVVLNDVPSLLLALHVPALVCQLTESYVI